MSYKKSYNISDEMLEKIISTAYGQASFLEKHKVNKLLKQDDRLRELYEEYKRTANLVHSIDLEELNKEFIITQKDSKERKSIIDEIYSIFLGKPLVYSAAVSVLIISIMDIQQQKLNAQIYRVSKH